MSQGMDRRSFLKLSLAATATVGLAGEAFATGSYVSGGPAPAHVEPDRWVYSTCGFCGTGCGIEIGVKGEQPVAVRGTKGYPVNDGLLCAKGIYQWQTILASDRGKSPLLRKDGKLVGASWNEALDSMVTKFKDLIAKHGPNSIACYNTGQMCMEEYYVLGKLMRAGIGTDNLDGNTRMCMASAVVGHARSFGTDGPVGAYADIEEADVIMISGSNMAECHPILFGRVVKARESRGTKLICIDPRMTQVARLADIYLPIRPGTDVTLLNAMAHVLIKEDLVDHAYVQANTTGYEELVEHLAKYTPEYAAEECGVPAELIVNAALMYGKAGKSLSMWVMGINQSVNGTQANNGFHNLNLLQGKIGKPGCASLSITGEPAAMASREVGGSSSYPGYRAIANEKHRAEVAALWGVDAAMLPAKSPSITEILDDAIAGKVKALWVICTNPLMSLPDQNRVRKALQNLEVLVVQDAYETADTAQYAHIYLPAAMWAEKSGILVNSERRMNLLKPSAKPPGEARPDFDIIVDVAQRMGYGNLFPFKNTADAFEEIKKMTAGRPNDYSGVTYARIEENKGLQWPVKEPDSTGTPRLYTDGKFNTPDGKAVLWAMDPVALPEVPDAEYPFMLNTGRVQEHYHTGTKTRKVPQLNRLVPGAYVELNPRDAEKLGLSYGDKVILESRRGQMTAKAVITAMIAPGSCFVPMHFNEGPVNALTVWAVDKYSKEPNFKQQAVRLRKA
ncbi:MAG TPA: molybdopterin-dependent oxidoreductase [Symbiobacteriaceae bacterium]|nr:molybdopterin-dependent oxidoreductase [Symbiobacteriaceae bacterium]